MQFSACVPALILVVSGIAQAQEPLSREQAVESAVSRGARSAVARADTLVGSAQLLSARQWYNPSLSASYTKSTPRYHEIVDFPLDISGVRSARIRSAEASRLASQYRFRFERAAVALDADTAYTRALAGREHLKLSHRNAADADSLRRMAVIRRNAGDASELDVLLTSVNAARAANLLAADSLTYASTLFDLQAMMGVDTPVVIIVPTDSLTIPAAADISVAVKSSLPVVAAEQTLTAAELSVTAQKRSIFSPFSVQAGIEHGDPSEPGVLPTFGVSIPLPVLNRNRAGIVLAEAERERARAELAATAVEIRAAIGRATRAHNLAVQKVQRDRLLVESASRITTMSITAYREGAQGLAVVLEAQRNARDIQSQYIEDVAEAWITAAILRLYGLVAPQQ
jgi:cobalt-zinc-cadmium efflux system outer membrane protein